jgi:hypothetical protein
MVSTIFGEQWLYLMFKYSTLKLRVEIAQSVKQVLSPELHFDTSGTDFVTKACSWKLVPRVKLPDSEANLHLFLLFDLRLSLVSDLSLPDFQTAVFLLVY